MAEFSALAVGGEKKVQILMAVVGVCMAEIYCITVLFLFCFLLQLLRRPPSDTVACTHRVSQGILSSLSTSQALL